MRTATNPQTGEKLILVGEEWKPYSKSATNPKTGEKAFLVDDEWVTDSVEPTEQPSLSKEQIEARRQAATKSMARAESPVLSKAADFLAGATTIPRSILNLIEYKGDKVGEKVFPTAGVDKESGTYTAGQIADPYAWVLGAKGMQLGQKAGSLIPIAGKVIEKSPVLSGIFGGAAGGAAVGAASEESDAMSGGLFGGMAGGAIPAISKGIGSAWDRLSGTSAGLKAKQIISEAYDDTLPAVRRLWQSAPSTVSATQAAAPVGSTKGAAMGEVVKDIDSQFYSDLARKQADEARALVAGVAGGQTQTASQAAQKQARTVLGVRTTPAREQALGQANIAREVTKRLSPQIDVIDDQIAAVAAAQKTADKSAIRFNAVASSEVEDIANKLGVQKDFLQRQLDSLSSYGLSPISTRSIVGRISEKLDDPALAGNKLSEKAMQTVQKEIEKWTEKGGGIIDAQALYAIRKNAVNAVVEKKLSAATPQKQAEVAAGILSRINPLIDDAIEKAGGTGWKTYLKDYAEGAKLIDRQKLGAKALELLDKNPNNFIRLVQNEDPKMVKKLFGTESRITDAMGSDYWPLAKAANQMQRDIELAKRAAEGRKEFTNLMLDKQSKFWMPRFIDVKLALIKEAGDVAEARLNKAMLNKLKMALRSGKGAEEIMNLLPATERNKFLNIFYTGKATPYTMGAVYDSEGTE